MLGGKESRAPVATWHPTLEMAASVRTCRRSAWEAASHGLHLGICVNKHERLWLCFLSPAMIDHQVYTGDVNINVLSGSDDFLVVPRQGH